MLLTDQQVRNHLRNEPDEDVSVYVGAAEQLAQEFMNRKVYPDAPALAAAVLDGTSGEDPMIVTDLVRSAILLIAAKLYAAREDEERHPGLTTTAESLLRPYRVGMGV